MAMRLELIPHRWREYEPPGLCHTGIEELVGLGAAATVTDISGGAGLATLVGSGAATAPLAAGVIPTLGATTVGAATGAGSALGLGTLGTAASIAGTGLSVIGGLNQSAHEKAAAEAEAAALKDKSNEDAAAGERAAITQDRKATLVQSRARALAAGSGTLATDPTEVTNEAKIAQQGNYNALSSLYEGLSRARSDTTQANIDLFRGNQIAAAAPLTAGATILSGLSNLATNRAQLRYYTKIGGVPSSVGL